MALLAAGIVVTATPAAGGGTRADLAGAPTPLKYVCAAKGSGVLRYVSSLARCRASERGLAIRPGPIFVCVSGDGSVRRVASARSCARSHRKRTFLRLPPLSGTLAFCAAREGGRLRYVSSPGKCGRSELRLSVVAADKAPTVTGSQPAAGAVGVATDARIVVTFSESVTAAANAFTLACPASGQQAFTVSGSPGQTITLTPTTALPAGTTCTVTALAARISDTDVVDAPDHPAADHAFSFTTDSAPAVTSTSPVNGAGGVGAGSDITIGFNEPVSAGPNAFTLQCPAGSPQPFTVSGSPGASITLHPSSPLPVGTTCAVGVIAAQISDTDTADPPDHPAADLTFTFTTAGGAGGGGGGAGGGGPVDTAPRVTATTPADHAADVPPGTGITVTFSEPVTATAASFTLACASTPQPFTVGGSGTGTITLTPTAPLPTGASCTVAALAAAISDVDTVDPPDHPTDDFTFTFTTVGGAPADTAPSVTGSTPADGATGIDPAVAITLTFSEPVTATAASFTIICASTPQPFTVGGSGTGTITLTPSAALPVASSCTVTALANAISDSDSNDPPDHPASNFSFSFGVAANMAPADIALSNASIDENQPSGTTIGTLTATDPAAQTHTFTLQAAGCGGGPFPDNSSFTIAGDVLRSAVSFDFEVKASYTICVRATDSGTPAFSFDKQLTITIIDVNDPPTVTPDSYTGAIGNTLASVVVNPSGPHVALAGNVLLANDSDEDGDPISAVPEVVTSTGGGTATISSTGGFTFLPGPGDRDQDDTFTYHVTDGTATTAGTVTVHIDDFVVWYVNNSGAAGDGRSSTPFNSLAALGGGSDPDAPGDTIFVYAGSGSYGGGIALEANQQLIGERAGLTVNGHVLVAAGATPVITNAAGAAIQLANGVDVEGLNVTGPSGAGISGTGVTTASVGTTSQVTVSGAGGDGIHLDGGTGNVTVAATVTGSGAHSVSVANRTGGTTAFSGPIDDTGTGITLSSNTGATVSFTGGVTASTGANAAFAATGGGTVAVTGAANTLTTTSGTALNVANTTIGAPGLTFQSISSNGADNGIDLDTTGTSGGLTVTGTGSAGSGGTIQHSTGSGILGKTTSNLKLSFMNVLDNGNALGESGIRLTDLTGTGAITSSTVSGSAEDNIYLMNTTATPLTSFTIGGAGCSVTNNSSTIGNVGLNLLAAGSANVTATVAGCSWSGNRTIAIRADSADNSTLNVTIRNNTITQGSPNHGNQGIEVSDAANGNVTFDIENNKVGTLDGTAVSPLSSTGINISNISAGNSVMVGKVAGNVVLNDSTVPAMLAATVSASGCSTSTRARSARSSAATWSRTSAPTTGSRRGRPARPRRLPARTAGSTSRSPTTTSPTARTRSMRFMRRH